MPDYYSPREAAEELHYSERHIRRLLQNGNLEGQRDAQGHWHIPKSVIQAKSGPQRREARSEQLSAQEERLEKLSAQHLPLLTRDNIIALAGASAGYVGFVAVLLYPIGVVTLWLQLLGSEYADDYGDAWYAAWLVSKTIVIPNVLFVFLFSLVIAIPLYLHVGWQAAVIVVEARLFALAAKGLELLVKGLERLFSLPKDTEPTAAGATHSGLVTVYLKTPRRVLVFLLPPVLYIPLLAAMLAIIFVGVYSPWRLVQFWLATAVPLALASVIALYFLVPVADSLVWKQEERDWRSITLLLAAVAFIFLASLIAAIVFVGLQSPDLPSVQFVNKRDEYMLITNSQAYWYTFDCDQNLLAIDKDNVAGNVQISTPKHGCNQATLPGWRKVIEAVKSIIH